MNTELLMVLCALFLAALGILASFFPQEILAFSGSQDEGLAVLVVQIAGALYLGFAFLNWTARASVLGGIYGRPVVLGNLLHFVVVTLALWKAVATGPQMTGVVAGAVVYSVFAVSFGMLLFVQPSALRSRTGDAR